VSGAHGRRESEGVPLGALKEAVRRALPALRQWTVLYTLLFRHVLETDMVARLDDSSRVWLPNRAEIGVTYGTLALR
jgi:hypothetical protein